MNKLNVGIVGANGFAGAEVLRLIASHPFAELAVATSRAHAGARIRDVFPALPLNLKFSDTSASELFDCDVVFVALPQTAGAQLVGTLIDKGVKVIDLSADYRFDDVREYERVYNVTHPRPDLCAAAVYGLCEVNRDKIRHAKLIANPGCYVTSALLPLIPLARAGLVSDIIIDSASGTSGAGRKADEKYSYCSVDENFGAYGVFTHRHAPEISEKLGTSVIFTPHLLPIKRGILSTIYFKTDNANAVRNTLKTTYETETFANYSEELPEIKHVAHTNRCAFSVRFDERDRGIIISALDNLLKGAAGQAVQNMNIMSGLDETAGLPFCAPI